MSFEQFISENRSKLLGYYLLASWFEKPPTLESCYPPSLLSEEELVEFKRRVTECMPLGSLVLDLWDSDVHFEEDLEDDWYFESAFGETSSVDQCAKTLADFFLKKVDEYDIDYNQSTDDEACGFEALVQEEALSFITRWRANLFARYAHIDAAESTQ